MNDVYKYYNNTLDKTQNAHKFKRAVTVKHRLRDRKRDRQREREREFDNTVTTIYTVTLFL